MRVGFLKKNIFNSTIVLASPEMKTYNENSNNIPQDLHYDSTQFEHLGPLVIKKEAKFVPVENTDNLEDTNPQDAHFYLTEKDGNFVYDIGSKVEIVRSDIEK